MNHAQVNKLELILELPPGLYVVKTRNGQTTTTKFDGKCFEVLHETAQLEIGQKLEPESIIVTFKFN